MRSVFVVAFICLFLAAVCSAQSKVDAEESARADSPCQASIKETVNVLKDILDKNRPVLDKANEILVRFVKCAREQQNIPACKELVTPDLKNLAELFKQINQDSAKRIADKVRDIVKNCGRQYFFDVIAPALLA